MVEDNRGDVLLIQEALKESNLKFELQHIADGEQAVDYVRSYGFTSPRQRPESNGTPEADNQATHGTAADSIDAALVNPSARSFSEMARSRGTNTAASFAE